MILLIHLNTLAQEVGLQSQLPSRSSFNRSRNQTLVYNWGELLYYNIYLSIDKSMGVIDILPKKYMPSHH